MVLVRGEHSASSEGLSDAKIRLINPKMSLLKLSIQYNRHTSIFIWIFGFVQCRLFLVGLWFSCDFSAVFNAWARYAILIHRPFVQSIDTSIRLHAMLNSINYQCRFEFRIYMSIRYVRFGSVHSKLCPIHRMDEKISILSSWRGRQNSIRRADWKKELHKHRLLRIENIFRYTWNVESRWEHRAKDRIIAL